MIDYDALTNELATEEGFVSYPYDDANDERLRPGVTIQGTPTFGHGLTFLTEDESRVVVGMRVKKVYAELIGAAPWIENLSEARQRALTDMAYNLGVGNSQKGLMSFNIFLSLMEAGQYEEAADDLTKTKWAQQVKSRSTIIEDMIRNG